MKTLMMNLFSYSNVLCLALAMLAFFSNPAQAQVQDKIKIWTSAASAGTVDEEDVNDVIFTQSLATLQPGINKSATIRYNVVAVDGLFAELTPTSWPALIVRYIDNGPGAHVVVRLKDYIMNGPNAGDTNTLITFDSNLYPQLLTYQTQSIGNCGVFTGFHFAPQIVRVYFIEAEITRSPILIAPGADPPEPGRPVLGGLAISRYGVCPN